MSAEGRRISQIAERLKSKKKTGDAAVPTPPIKTVCPDKFLACSRWYFHRAVTHPPPLQQQDF